jgi:FkbM family methyltransferase
VLTRAGPAGRSAIGAATRALAVVRFTWRHPSNRRRRARAVAGVVWFQARGRLAGVRAIAPVGSSSRLWADASVYISARAMYGNPLDWNEMQAWARVIGPGSLFVDVGANVGLYTIWALDRGAEVLAVEPDRRSLQRLEENLALNGYRAEVAPVAVGEAEGSLRMTDDLDQQNHLVLDPAATATGGAVVPVRTLDDLVGDRTVDGLKVDVEGAELLVLRGATRLLSEQRIRLAQLEWNDASQDLLGQDRRPVRDLLAEHGYELLRPDGDGRLVPVDGLDFGPDVFARPRVDPSG